jgi:hypothetical protein
MQSRGPLLVAIALGVVIVAIIVLHLTGVLGANPHG